MKSRTHRLGLSNKGVDAFLACHHRLACLTRSFIPYGATLYVALLIAETLDAEAIVEQLDRPRTLDYAGPKRHCVGTPAIFSDLVLRLIDRVVASDFHWKKPRSGEIYLACLNIMIEAEDAELSKAYQRMQAQVGRN